MIILGLFWIFSIQSKSEVAIIFHNFHIMIECQLGYKIKNFQTDFAGAF